MRIRIGVITLVSCCATLAGCSKKTGLPVAAAPAAGTAVEVVWGPGARCGRPEVDAFVEHALQTCASGTYDDYRLLWSYKYQPTNRRRFEQVRQAMKRVDVRLVKRVRLREPDGNFREEDGPVYAVHASVAMKESAKERSEHRLDDRELVLLVVHENEAWRLTPTRPDIKQAILSATENTRTTVPAADPHAAAGSGD